MTINERVSPKRLAEIIARAEVCDDSVLTDYRDIESIARELQQYRAAAEQCVGEVIEQPGLTSLDGTVSYEKSTYRNIKGINKMKRMPLGTKFYAAPQVTSVPDGIEAAARWVDAQREAYDDEHGRYDPDTGTFEFGNDAQLEYSTTLAEIAEGIRALRPTAAPAVQAEQLSGNAEQVSQPYTLREGLAAIRNLGPIDAEKIQAERDALNEPDVPDGYALVPIEPTLSMLTMLGFTGSFESMKQRYESMLAAAPAAPYFREMPNSSTNNCRENAETSTKCWCLTCRPVTMTDMRFVVCPECGNKRCPHANDHRNACTGSNAPGQEGSAYPDAPKQEAE